MTDLNQCLSKNISLEPSEQENKYEENRNSEKRGIETINKEKTKTVIVRYPSATYYIRQLNNVTESVLYSTYCLSVVVHSEV